MKLTIFLISFTCLLNDAPAHAYVFTRNSAGTALRWATPVRPSFYANWSNNDLLSYSSIFTMLTNALQRWTNAGSAELDFTYYQSANGTSAWGYDRRNAVFFQSQAPASQKLSNSTIGVTYVFSDAASGEIVEVK